MKTTKIHQFKKVHKKLKIKVIHAKPIFGNVDFLSVHPIVNWSRDIRISAMCEDNDVSFYHYLCSMDYMVLPIWGSVSLKITPYGNLAHNQSVLAKLLD